MNREILYKAKRKDWRTLPKEDWWVEGYYVFCRKHHYILPIVNKIIGYDEREDEWFEIDQTTICQYTGCTDKNSKKIWENDVVRWRFKRPWKEEYHVSKVLWDDFYSGWKLTVPGGMAKMRKDVEYDVIGNIFDDKELLAVE